MLNYYFATVCPKRYFLAWAIVLQVTSDVIIKEIVQDNFDYEYTDQQKCHIVQACLTTKSLPKPCFALCQPTLIPVLRTTTRPFALKGQRIFKSWRGHKKFVYFSSNLGQYRKKDSQKYVLGIFFASFTCLSRREKDSDKLVFVCS